MRFLKNTLFCILICFSGSVSAQYIVVDDTYSAQQLVENVLIHSPCANVTNFSVSGDTFSAGQQSYGYFSNSSPSFSFAEGVVLSTARAVRSEGPNNNLVDEGAIGWTGDADLQQALGIGNTFNATVLEFDFRPLTSQISFDYIFASEEYSGTAPCRYSDGFAFLLKPVGSSLPYENLAVLPNTNTPVLVTTVHPEISGSCPAINEAYFGGFNPSNYPTNFNGQTVVLTAKSNVIPGTTYHIKLVIADEENIRYDSAIFLGARSFRVGTDIGPDRLISSNNPLCVGQTYPLDATEPGSNTYQWFKDGNPITGETNPTYTVINAGDYSVEVNLGGSGCIATGEATIEYATLPVLNNPTNIVQCDDNNDGITTYNLTSIDNIVKMGDASLGGVGYFENLSDAQNGINPILNPTAYQNTTTNQLTARVENAFGCVAYAVVNLQIANNALPAQNPVASCDDSGDEDGITAFTLSTQVTPQVLAGLPSGLVVEYYASEADAITHTNPLPDNFTNTIPLAQTIYALIVNGPDCYGIVPVQLVIHTFNPDNFSDETVYLCDGNPVTLAVPNIFSSYLWSTANTGNSIVVTTPGIYSVAVTDVNGCSVTKNFNVLASGIAAIDWVEIHDFSQEQNSVLVHYTGNGNYEFSLGGNVFQDSPLFNNVPPGEYFVYIRDQNGCGTSPPFQIFVMDYPKFFTPNGDGYNDLWDIKYLNRQPNARVNIFDRYGKLVYSFKGNGVGWNGKCNNNDLPSTDYWFTITLENGRTVKSHFSLKR
jgi:gliding motility-associated-like protein